VKLVAMMGLFLGLDSVIAAVAVSSVLGLVVGGIWIAVHRKDSRTYELPYGTFLAAGGILLMLLQILPDFSATSPQP
jgi:leader peptidase (prepilin peptidase)/N-methyltransferase